MSFIHWEATTWDWCGKSSLTCTFTKNILPIIKNLLCSLMTKTLPKSVRIRSFFFVFWVSFRIQSVYGRIRARILRTRAHFPEWYYLLEKWKPIIQNLGKKTFNSVTVCDLESMKSPVELNSLSSKFFCCITWSVMSRINESLAKLIDILGYITWLDPKVDDL